MKPSSIWQIKCLLPFVAIWCVFNANMAIGQSFTTPGGIGFSIPTGNYTAVLGNTNYFPVTLQQINDGDNSYDGDSADGCYGCIGEFYDTLYEYEILSTSETYWTTNVAPYGKYEYEYYAGGSYWTNNYLGYCKYFDPITSAYSWTNTYLGNYEYDLWNGTNWEAGWFDDPLGDDLYEYELWNGSDWVDEWLNNNYGLSEYETTFSQDTSWSNTFYGDYQYQKYNLNGTVSDTFWTDTWQGAFQYDTGWTANYGGKYEYAEYYTDGELYDYAWTDDYPGGEYWYETYEWDDDEGEWIDYGGGWTDAWSGLDYYEDDGYVYICCLDKLVDKLDQAMTSELVGQQITKEISELNQEMTEEQIDAETDYLYYAPWFIYAEAGADAETTIKLSDNAGNNNVEYGTVTFVPLTDTLSVPLSYPDNGEAGPDIMGTLTVEDTDPDYDDFYYAYCYPEYIYSAIDASGTAGYAFYNPNTDMYAAVDVGGDLYTEEYVVETNAGQIAFFRASRTDTYNGRNVYYTITATALNNPNDTVTFSNSVSFAANGLDYVDIPVTNYLPGVSGPVSVTLTLQYASDYAVDPYQVDEEYDSAVIWFVPEPTVNITVNGGTSTSVTESETPQNIPIQFSVSNLWLDTTVYFNVSGTAQNGGAYSAPWSGNSGSVMLTGNGSIPVTSGGNISASQTLTVSLATDPGEYQVGTPSGVTITFLPNTNNVAATDTGTTDPGSGQTFRPLPVPYNNVNVSGLKNGAGTGILSNTVSGLPVALVNVQTLSPYATAVGPTPGVFCITSSGWTNAFTVNYTISGTAIPGSNYTALSGSVQFAANQSSTNLTVNVLTNAALTSAQTVVLTLNPGANYYLGDNAQALVTLLPSSSLTNSVAGPSGRYWRGSGNDPTYWSQVIPLDYETGTVYSNLNGNCSNLYSGLSSWSSQTLYHYNAAAGLPQTNIANRLAFNNPIVAFGERVGGTPLYFGQPHGFGIYAGDPLPSATQIVIQAYYRTNDQLAGSISVLPPNYFNTNSMVGYATNGFQVTTNAFGLSTTLSDSPSLNWGATSLGAYVLTHSATALASNYYYLVEVSGYPAAGSNAMVINASGIIAPSLLYTLEFEAIPPWRSIFLNQPQFTGQPMPPIYSGMTLDEMLTNTPPVTNAVNFNPSAATTLDDSPELQRHPILDSFVASMGNDPIALANYVINQIDLTDPMDYSDSGNIAEQAINPGGVSRGALGTFMEKQGSAADQCALLVYLLRQAGVPAVYEFAPRNGLQILDARLSQMLRFQIQGAVNEAGQLYTTNAMIAVNYPWVAAYVGTNWVHIFPWLKDYEITESFNLYDYMPANYSSAYPWVRDYIYGGTNLLALAANGDNTPSVIFPAYLKQTLQQNHPGLSVSDLGVQILHRQHNYARWQDFPTPTWVTNISAPLESLTSSGITNISPTLTNIFDTVSVEVYSLANPTNNIQTGNLRLVDLHNREFYIYQNTNAANSNLVQLSLILLPFRTNVTTQLAYTNDPTLLSREVLTMNLGSNEMQLGVRFAYQRHRALSAAYPIDPGQAFLGYEGCDNVNLERPLLKGDQAAICLDYGRVTQDMLNVYATEIWQMENQVQLHPSMTNSISPDLYEGAVMYLAGMSYYKNVSDFNVVNENLNKVCLLSTWAAGLSKLGAARDGFGYLTNGLVIPVLPSVDMFYYETAMVGNGTVQPDSGQTAQMAQQNYNLISILNNSAEEHQIINSYYQQTNAVSTVRLLQLSQSQDGGIVPLNYNNYLSQGQASYQGQPLQNWDAGLWAQVANSLQNSPYTLAYMTPGPVSNSAYAGMGALILGWNQWQALISPENLNGATGTPLAPNSVSPGNIDNYDLTLGDPFQFAFMTPPPDTTTTPTSGSSENYQNNLSQILNGTTVNTATSVNYYNQVGNLYNLPMSGSDQNNATLFQTSATGGDPGNVGAEQSEWEMFVADPVGTVTGEHYINETDLQLPGPLPLALRRNYSSQNLADNQFGTGWKLSILSYLTVASGGTNIYAADMDGAVLAYVQTATNADVWIPTLAANPLLANDSTAGVGGLANRLRDRIVQTVSGTTTNYTLYGADGSTRVFKVVSFNNGILNQTRPYLQTWTDSRGNYYTFAYGTDSTQPNFGQLIRIQASNGNFLGFDFDVNAHIIDAYSGDGRWMYYNYDDYGDLVSVTLPDDTTHSYIYQHATQAVTNGVLTYSTHLIIEEDKPEGRVLQNAYDSQRRVTNQMSTAGANLVPVRTASFVFANNFVFTNSYTNRISGYTLIVDGNGNTNRYDYTNSLITKITDPLGQTIQQTWYPDNATAPGFPRSLSQVVDKRGTTNQFQYDANGNITNTATFGDLTGNGITTQTATSTAFYNSNSLPVQMTDPVGNSTVIVYDPVFNYLPQQVIRYAGNTPVFTNWTIYGNATNVVADGNVTQTNVAFGLPFRQIRAYGSPDAATSDMFYNGNGFLTETIRYSGTTDPNVTTTFFYNERGQIINRVDALGAVTFFDYDALNRPIEQENFDEFGNALAWNFTYYDDNGEVSWTDGPRYNPEDYIFYDHDGAGRVTSEIHWRSQANPNGTGVEAPSGYNLYAQTFYQYDILGNLLLKVDPRGAMTTNSFDALSRLVQTKHLDVNGVTVLSTEGYSYEPGGQVQSYTNALGGVATTLYTGTGKPETRFNADGSTNGWRYYLDGRINREIQRNGAYWQTTYDDVNRITTRTFYSAAGVAETINSIQLDRRGNIIQKVDAGNNVFTNTYDGLDRPKITAGPAIVTVNSVLSGMNPGGPVTYQTNVLQQTVTTFYDAAGRAVTNINALGEQTITTMDALGRATSTLVYSASSSLAREKYFAYSADHNSVTVTDGSGATAISHTTYTDNDGHVVLSIAYPWSGCLDYTWRNYDLSGNLAYEEHDTTSPQYEWTFAGCAHDGLNRLTSMTNRDNAVTFYTHDALGDMTSRTIPGGLQWTAVYNDAGQVQADWLVGSGGVTTRSNSYTYYPGGNAFAGLLDTMTDGRGMVSTYSYDDWLRYASIKRTDLDYTHVDTFWTYDPRGYATNILEQNTGWVLGNGGNNPKVVSRTYDPYGQLSSETITWNGATVSTASQSWDATGRRTGLSLNDANYGYGWRADGAMTYAADPTGSGNYGFDTAGLLTNRVIGSRTTTVNDRDGEGRPYAITTSVNGANQLIELMEWYGDGKQMWDTYYEPTLSAGWNYFYAAQSRRLTQEQFGLEYLSGSGTNWTDWLTYDSGVAGGPGVLTQMGDPNQNCANWNGGVSPFSRVNTETNTSTGYSAYGRVNGQSALTALLDGQPVAVTTTGTNDAYAWSAQLQLTPGTHQLAVKALNWSGFYTASATSTFTNKMGYEAAAITRDYDGNIIQRTWSDTNGAMLHQQKLYFDVKNHLTDIIDADGANNGFVWHAEYDGLDRRFVTEYYVMTGGNIGITPQTIYQYYDPNVEFLELGVSVNNQTTWKLYGPDLNGKYGGLNGTGGLDGVSPYLNEFNPVISDCRGNILAEVTNGVVSWNSARPTGYGFVPGYQPIALGHGADLTQACAWRGRWMDATGYYQIGLRPYDPVAGNWLSYDSVFDQHNPNGLSAFGGDPINYFDSDGRCIETGLDMLQRTVGGVGQLGATGYDLLAQTAWAAGGSGGEYQGVSQLYQNIYNNPSSGPTAGNILGGTLQTDANIATLGLYGMAQGYYNGVTTGDYTQAQNASLNALLLSSSAQGMVNQGINPYGLGNISTASPPVDFNFNFAPEGDSSPLSVGGSTSVTSPNAAARGAVQGSYINPLSNEQITTTDPLAADHIYPQSEIQQMPGFNNLPPNYQSQVLNNPANIRGLPPTFNSSKGAQLNWTTYKGQPLNPQYIQNTTALQVQQQQQLQQQIYDLLNDYIDY
jgi:RHS repeat-associated protein